jgi:catechol 2,3-dioxygenase-like lactoylglutathione lyase family enzyme
MISMCAIVSPLSSAWAQLLPPNAAGVSMGHLHYFVRDMAANRKFWIDFGATPVMLSTREVMRLPGLTVLLTQGEPSGNSEGSVVNHVGFLVPNVPATMKKMADLGYKVKLSASATGKVGNVWTSEGERIEMMEDQSINAKFAPDDGPYVPPPKMTVPITLHHIHIYAPAGEVTAAKDWYVKVFGAPYEAADLPGVNMNYAAAHGPVLPTKGRALDHIGFEVRNL